MTQSVVTGLASAAALVLAFGFAAAPAVAQDDQAAAVAALGGDAKKGKRVFRKCQACHVVDEEKNRVGPNLMHAIGRPAAHVADYEYSDAMKNSGLTWTVEELQGYLADPKGTVEGTKMTFAGLKKEDDIANVLSYMLEAGGGVYQGE